MLNLLLRVIRKRLERLARQAAASQRGSTLTLIQAAISIIGGGHDEDGHIAARHLEAGLRRSHNLQPHVGWLGRMGSLHAKSPIEFLQQF